MASDSGPSKEPDPALIASYQAGVRRVNWAIVIWLASGAFGLLADFAIGNINLPLENSKAPVVTLAVMFLGLFAIGILAWTAAFCPACRAFIKVGGHMQFCPQCGVRLAQVKDGSATDK